MDIILVHGLWADGSSWNGVIRELLDDPPAGGGSVVAVQLQLSSQDDDVATVHRALDRVGGPAILVGHSYGGTVISAATPHPKVRGLVFASAYVPDAGEDAQTLNAAYPDVAGGAAIRPTEDGHLWLDVDMYPSVFAGDVDGATGAVMARTQGPAAFACLAPMAGEPGWKTLPSWSLISTEDQVIHPDLQRFMSGRHGGPLTEVVSSHASPVSHPADVAALVRTAVSTVSA